MEKEKKQFKIGDVLRVFRPFWWLILVVALLIACAFGTYSYFKKDTYTSSAQLMVSKADSSTSFDSSDRMLSSDMAETYAVVIKTHDFCRWVVEKIKLDEGYDESWNVSEALIRNSLSVSKIGDTEIFRLNVTTDNPKMSQTIAFVASEELSQYHETQNWPYQSEIQCSVIDSATAGTLNGKNELRNSILGFIIGAVVAMVVIFIRSIFDVTIHDRKKIEDNFDIPLLGVIPKFVTDEEAKSNV